MKVYIVADIEGMAGVVFYQSRGGSYLAQDHILRNNLLMTEEVNAAIRGALSAGADTVYVMDHHGVGYNVMPERLHERAELIHGRSEHRVALGELHPDLDASFHALVLLGMHAKAGTRNGCTPHSLVRVVNDRGEEFNLSEATNSAAYAGHFNVPTVFIAGDRAVCHETQVHVPGIETVVTKVHYAPQFARTISPRLSRRLIEAGVKKALERREDIQPFRIEGRCTLTIADRNPERGWPENPKEYSSFAEALVSTLKDVPWYREVTAGDDGWRYPDDMIPKEGVNVKWN